MPAGGRHSAVLDEAEDVAVKVGEGGYQAAASDIVRGLLHGRTRRPRSDGLAFLGVPLRQSMFMNPSWNSRS